MKRSVWSIVSSLAGGGRILQGKGPVVAALILLLGIAIPFQNVNADTANFSEVDIGNTQRITTLSLPKAWCDGDPNGLKQVIVTFGQARMWTDLANTNTSGDIATFTVENIRHLDLNVAVPDAGLAITNGLLPNETGQDYCIPDPCGGPSPTGNWIWENLAVGATVNRANVFETIANGNVVILNEGDAGFDAFKGASAVDTIDVTFTVRASISTDQPGTWFAENETKATASVSITYVCGEPGLSCVSKTFSASQLAGPDGVVTATVTVQNTGDIQIDDVVVVSVMSDAAKMAIVPGTSTHPGGDPVQGPAGTWTFPETSLAAGANLEFSYDVQITGMAPGESLCNQATVYSEDYGISSDGPGCRACIGSEPQEVPAFSAIGLLALFGLIPLSRLLIGRRRNR